MRLKSLITLLFSCFCISCYSQIIEGIVLDEQTKQPLEGATVYFDGTTIVAITKADGSFKINGGSVNNTLVITYVGYIANRINEPQSLVNKKVKILLRTDSTQLDEVTIGKSPFSRKQMLEAFRREFLGTSRAALSCKIQNENDLVLFFDVSDNTLTATSRNPLRIKNNYLEYDLHFDLIDFALKFNSKSLEKFNCISSNFSGTTFFKDISTNGKNQEKRQKTFLGSAPHLMRAIAYNTMDADGFEFYVASFRVDPKIYFESIDTLGIKKIKLIKEPQQLVAKVDPKTRKLPDYNAKVDPKNMELQKAFINVLYKRDKQSVIDFAQKELIVDQDGNYEPIYGILFGGYIGTLKAGDMLPRDFYQSVKTKSNQ